METQKARQSTTIQWAVVSLIVALGGKYGFLVDEATLESIATDIASIATTVGIIYGRVKGIKRIEGF